MFSCESYGDRDGDKKSKFLGDIRIEYHWVKDNRPEKRPVLALADLEPRVELKKGDEGDQHIWELPALHYKKIIVTHPYPFWW